MAIDFMQIKNGLSLGNLSADPSSPNNGDFYYNTTSNTFRGYQNGAWIDLTASSQSVSSIKTSTYAIQTSDQIIRVDPSSGAFVVTLPTAIGVAGKEYTILQVGANSSNNTATLATSLAQTIGQYSSIHLTTKYESWTIYSDGANWQIKSHKADTPWSSSFVSFTANNFGTVTSQVVNSRRVGDTLEVSGYWTNGTVSSSLTASISIGSGLILDTSKLDSGTANSNYIGNYDAHDQLQYVDNLGVPRFGQIFANSGQPTMVFLSKSAATGQTYFDIAITSNLMSSNGGLSFKFAIPIANWEA